jgi:hypothetical protein
MQVSASLQVMSKGKVPSSLTTIIQQNQHIGFTPIHPSSLTYLTHWIEV